MRPDGELPPESEDPDPSASGPVAPTEDTDSESSQAEAPPEGSDWYTGPVVAPLDDTDSEAGEFEAPTEGQDPDQFKRAFARESADFSDAVIDGSRTTHVPTAGFHATRDENVGSIMDSGLDPSMGGGPNGAGAAVADDDDREGYAKNSRGKVHYTSSLGTANDFRNFLDNSDPGGAGASVLGVDLEGTVWPYKSPPPWDDPNAPDAVRAAAPGQPASVERDPDAEDEAADPFALDMQAFRTTGPIPPENITPAGLNTDISPDLEFPSPDPSDQGSDLGSPDQDDGTGDYEPENFSDSGSVMQFRVPGSSTPPAQPDDTMDNTGMDDTMETPPDVEDPA